MHRNWPPADGFCGISVAVSLSEFDRTADLPSPWTRARIDLFNDCVGYRSRLRPGQQYDLAAQSTPVDAGMDLPCRCERQSVRDDGTDGADA